MPDLLSQELWQWILAGIVVLVAAIWLTSRFGRVTIYEYQQGLRYRNGRYVGTVDPGRYWIDRQATTIDRVDLRLSVSTIPGQEIVTTDGVTVKISLALQQRIADANVAINKVENYHEAVYNTVHVALREVVGSLAIDDVLARRGEIGPQVLERSVESVRALGVELVAVDVKDLMLGPATKKLFAQTVDARQRGLAALEKARGETAALRSLANAARMVEANPSLLQLRLLQQLEGSSGNTVLLGMPPSSSPIPVKQVEAGVADFGRQGNGARTGGLIAHMFWRRKRGRALFRPHELVVLDALLGALAPEARALIERQIEGTQMIHRLFNTAMLYPSRGRKQRHDPAIEFVNRSREQKLATVGVRGAAAAGRVTIMAVWGHVFELAFHPEAKKLGPPSTVVVTSVKVHADPMLPDDGAETEARLAGLDPDLRRELDEAWQNGSGARAGLLARDDAYRVDLDDGTWLMLVQFDDTTFAMARIDPSRPGLRRFDPEGDVIEDYPSLGAALAGSTRSG